VRSIRVLLEAATVGGLELPLQQGHLHVVLRDGDELPGPTDWEVLLVTEETADVRPGAHLVALVTIDERRLRGRALVRFSDGHRHLLRGDDDLGGVEHVLT
jgi:hypothetical protein